MKRIPLLVAILSALVILGAPAYILRLTWSGYGGSASDGLLTLDATDRTLIYVGRGIFPCH